MAIGILGNKVGMTQIFDSKGNAIPVTLIKTGPCFVTQIKSLENCGYQAVQLGYSEIVSKKKIKRPNLGHCKKSNLPVFRYLKEFRVDDETIFTPGQSFGANFFQIGQKVKISGLTIGKGNQGSVKRNNFHRGPMSHGSKHHRLQGSLGPGSTPGRVFPGKRMAGRMGGEMQTVSGLEVIEIKLDNQLLIVKGCIPGKLGNLVTITTNNL